MCGCVHCLGTNGKRVLTGTRCPLECPSTRSRPAGITVHRLKFIRRRHKHRKWITFSVFSFSFLCVSSKMLNFNICMLRRVFSMVRVRVPFFFFLQVRFFFNGLDCSFNNKDSPTSVHSLPLEFHIHDLFYISIQIVCQRLSLVIHT